MTPADQAYVKQCETWMETQVNSIRVNKMLIGTYEQQIGLLKSKIECELREAEACLKTLEAYKQQLAQFIEERKDL
jgi:DNA integrity scanning protein DisA with diadenylate cyclase activity